MLIWGSGGDTIDLDSVGRKHCKNCDKDNLFRLFLEYEYHHFYYVFKWVSKKKYLMLCNVCHTGYELDKKAVEKNLKKDPIPFSHRYGLVFLVGLMAIAVALLNSQTNESSNYLKSSKESDYKYISSPKVNDIYLTDISTLMKDPERSPMYGALKIKSIVGDQIGVVVSKIGYGRSSGPKKDIRSGEALDNDYYEHFLVLPLSEIKSMREQGVISEVHRINNNQKTIADTVPVKQEESPPLISTDQQVATSTETKAEMIEASSLEEILRKRAEEDKLRQEADAKLEKERHERMQRSVEAFADDTKSTDWYQ